VFLAKASIIDQMRTEYVNIVDQINLLNLEINQEYVVNYQSLSTFDEMFYAIKMMLSSLQPRSLQTLPPTCQSDSPSLKQGSIRIPQIELPGFSG
ncbi:hypothetical protein Q8G50_30680, partial [Klebsiella pneumoniae]